MSWDFCLAFGEEREDASVWDASGNSFISKWRRAAVHTLNCNNYTLFIRRNCAIKNASPVEGISPSPLQWIMSTNAENYHNSAIFDVLI